MTALREQRSFGASAARARASRAFTLVELLIAISILGVGITMAAALFPTAIKQNERSANDTIGMIVAKNALAVVKAKVTLADVATVDENFHDLGTGLPQLLTEADLTYPVPRQPVGDFDGAPPGEPKDWDGAPPRPVALRGSVVLGRRFNLGRNDFQLVVVSFAKQDRTNTIELIGPFGVTINQDGRDWAELTVTGAAPTAVQRGGVVIFGYHSSYPTFAGTFARIRAAQGGGRAILDRKFDPGNLAELDELDVWLIVERDADPPNGVVGAWSPVTSVLVTRTALRDQ